MTHHARFISLALLLSACGGGDDPPPPDGGGMDGGLIVIDGARPDARVPDGSTGTDGGTEWCASYMPPPPEAMLCTSTEACGGGGSMPCYPAGDSCCPVKMAAPRACESDPDCSGTEVCEEYVPTDACTFGLGTRCVPPCTAGTACGDGEGSCDGTGHCVPSACPADWTCPENHECEPTAPSADRHGCARVGCTTASECDCGECVNGVCHAGPGYCGFACACAAPDTPIATPEGERTIAELQVGDLVYTVERDAVVVAPILLVRRRVAPPGHEVLRVTLASGRTFRMSANHPTAEGAMLGDVGIGALLGDAEVLSVEREPYDASHTYDILPASASGAYFAAGALVGSTLR